jgi:hypothetical protein
MKIMFRFFKNVLYSLTLEGSWRSSMITVKNHLKTKPAQVELTYILDFEKILEPSTQISGKLRPMSVLWPKITFRKVLLSYGFIT